MSIKLVYKFILIMSLATFPVIASDKEEKEYKKIERIITEGKIIHKKTTSWFWDDEEVTPNAINGRPDTLTDLEIRNYKLSFLISYKKKLYDCTYNGKDVDGFIHKDGWSCMHIFESN